MRKSLILPPFGFFFVLALGSEPPLAVRHRAVVMWSVDGYALPHLPPETSKRAPVV